MAIFGPETGRAQGGRCRAGQPALTARARQGTRGRGRGAAAVWRVATGKYEAMIIESFICKCTIHDI